MELNPSSLSSSIYTLAAHFTPLQILDDLVPNQLFICTGSFTGSAAQPIAAVLFGIPLVGINE